MDDKKQKQNAEKLTRKQRDEIKKRIGELERSIDNLDAVKPIRAEIAELERRLSGEPKETLLQSAERREREADEIIKRIKEIPRKDRTDSQRAELAAANAEKKSAKVIQQRAKADAAKGIAAALKMKAIIKNLTENEIKTENEVKEMLKTRKYLAAKGIKNLDELKARLEPPKQ